MNLTPIKNETNYRDALARLEDIFETPIGSHESDEADILGVMIDDYENRH